MIVFLKSHPAVQGMSAARAPADLNEPSLRRSPGEPDAGQSASGKYRKPRIEWQGLTIAIENPAGSVRRGRNRDGVTWEQRMQYAYGEILGSMGVDGDPVDVFLGPNMDAPMVYVVHQRKVNRWDEYDEDKCMVGFDSEDEAKAAFLACYTDPRFLGPVTALPVAEFIAKVRATRDAPAMIKAVLFFKAHVGPYLRGGKVVNLAGYQGRPSRAVASPGQMSLFGGPSSGKPLPPSPLQGKDAVAHTPDMFADEPQHTEPTRELIAEHERLVDVLNSPSHADDKAEAKKQAAELAEMKREAGITVSSKTKVRDPMSGTETHVTLSNGKTHRLQRLNSTESMGLPGWHDLDGGFLDDTEDGAIQRLLAQHNSASPAGEHDHLLADIPGAKWRRGKGLIAGHYGVEVDGEGIGNYHAKPEDAAAQAKQWLANRAAAKDEADKHSAAVGKLRDRLLSGGESTDADLKLLGLKDGSSGLKWFIPAAAKVFGITSHAVRPHIKDMIRIGHTDMGTKLEFVSPKKALQAIAAGIAGGEKATGGSSKLINNSDMEKVAKPKVTPQVATKSQLESMIKIAADSIEKLRTSDVDRVLSEAPTHFRLSLSMHIKSKRPDLASEVDDVLAELSAGR